MRDGLTDRMDVIPNICNPCGNEDNKTDYNGYCNIACIDRMTSPAIKDFVDRVDSDTQGANWTDELRLWKTKYNEDLNIKDHDNWTEQCPDIWKDFNNKVFLRRARSLFDDGGQLKGKSWYPNLIKSNPRWEMENRTKTLLLSRTGLNHSAWQYIVVFTVVGFVVAGDLAILTHFFFWGFNKHGDFQVFNIIIYVY